MKNEWNLELIYKNKEDYENDIKNVLNYVSELESLKGKLNNKDSILKYCKYNTLFEQTLSKVFSYAHQKHDLNQKDIDSFKEFQRIYQLYLQSISKLSFIEPELLNNDLEFLLDICKNNKEVCQYKFIFEKIFKLQEHVRSVEIEGVMSAYNDSTSGYTNLYDNLVVKDNKPKEIEINNEKISVSMANYSLLLENTKSQDDRRKIAEAQYSFYQDHKNTFAGIYKGIMASLNAERINRGYKSTLEFLLDRNNISTDVFLSLIDVAANNNDAIKKYYDLKKKYFKLDKLYTFDRFLQINKSNIDFSYEKMKELVLDADKFFGDDFYNKAKLALEDGRVSVEAKDGKTTGAYSTSVYDSGTFILLNNNNSLDSAFTLAHEAGHSIHSIYSIEAQPFELSEYTIFVAEVASTFNEARFLDYLLSKTNNKEERITLLQKAIDNIIATFYRQALFANYEYLAFKKYEDGEVIDSEVLSNIMKDLYMKYYGLNLDDEEFTKLVWVYIPHLYHSPFYVYQYATSYAASALIYENVKNGDKEAFDKYINLLKSGGSDYPINLLKKAGVDLTKKDAFLAVARKLDMLVNKLEEELKL